MTYLLDNWLAIGQLVVGILLLSLAIANGNRANAAKNWPSVTGTITKSSIVTKTRKRRSRSVGSTKKHLPEIQFSYMVNQSQLINKQLYFKELSAAQVVKKFPVGTTAKVTYNPDDINDSFLEPPSTEDSVVIMGMGALLAFIGGAFLLTPYFFGAKKNPAAAQSLAVPGISSNLSENTQEN